MAVFSGQLRGTERRYELLSTRVSANGDVEISKGKTTHKGPGVLGVFCGESICVKPSYLKLTDRSQASHSGARGLG